MKKYLIELLYFSRLLVILVTLLAIGVSGANAAARLFSLCQIEDLTSAVTLDFQQIVPESTPKKDDDEMAPGSKANSEQEAYIFAVPAIPVNSSQSRLIVKIIISEFVFHQILPVNQNFSPIETVALISSHLGQSFTLVGAKPSGTG